MYSSAFSTFFPRRARASSIAFFHGIGSSRPYARAIDSILNSTVQPSFAMSHLLQRHELRRPRRTDARPAVLHGPPGHRELPQIVPDHLGLDLDGLERLPVVDRGFLADEVRQDRDVPAVRPESLLVPL